MKIHAAIWILLMLILLAGCQPAEPVCPEGTITFAEAADVIAQPAVEPSGPEEVEIRGRLVSFDQVIHGPLCNNDLAGKVYIACDLEIAKWEEAPNFLDGCNFNVEEGSVIYVAAHNNTPYYKGCASCHVGSAAVEP